MAIIEKPTSLNSIWAVAGDKARPDEEKMQRGWLVEIPLRQHFNWLENRRDTAIAHLNQMGIVAWDAETPYVAGRSYVQGGDGRVYKAVIDNKGVNPISGGSEWRVAFVDAEDIDSFKLFVGYQIISSNIPVAANMRYYAIADLTVTLPAAASGGDNVVLNKSPNVGVVIKVMNGGKINTLNGRFDEVVFDVLDEVNVVWNGSEWQTS